MINNSKEIKEAIKEILWMSRRYADGRNTYAPVMFNNAYDILRNIFGDEIEYNNPIPDTTLTEKGKYFPYAQDGSLECVKGRKYYKEKNEQRV